MPLAELGRLWRRLEPLPSTTPALRPATGEPLWDAATIVEGSPGVAGDGRRGKRGRMDAKSAPAARCLPREREGEGGVDVRRGPPTRVVGNARRSETVAEPGDTVWRCRRDVTERPLHRQPRDHS